MMWRHLRWLPLWAAEGEGDGGDGGKETGDTGDDGSLLDRANAKKNGAADDDKGVEGGKDTVLQTERPEWLPEQFWDAEKGELRGESMAKAWKDTRQALDDAKQKKGAPETVDGYLDGWEMPKTEDGKSLARSRNVEADDAALKIVAEVAHDIGMPKKDFDKLVRQIMIKWDGLLPEAIDQAAEIEALGGDDAADRIIVQVADFGTRMFEAGDWNEAEFQAWRGMNRTAAGVSLAAKMMKAAGEKPVPLHLEQDGVKSEAELQSAMNDPRYKTDPAYRASVQRDYRKRYGSKPTMPGSQHSPTFTD